MSPSHDPSQHLGPAGGAAQPPETPTLADLAYAALKRLIFDFVLMLGERCSESELAQRLIRPIRAVSRSADSRTACDQSTARCLASWQLELVDLLLRLPSAS